MNQPSVPEQGVVTNSPLNPNHPSSSAYEGELELMASPSGWESLPGFIRFAVWLWALATVIGGVVGVVAGAGMLLALVLS